MFKRTVYEFRKCVWYERNLFGNSCQQKYSKKKKKIYLNTKSAKIGLLLNFMSM